MRERGGEEGGGGGGGGEGRGITFFFERRFSYE